ncbi:hypothetical protein BV96_04575 [Sphingomonas paucimobilis]|nr:hypothetical protein BV96_04575 [Sphingomonas paucimobilis]
MMSASQIVAMPYSGLAETWTVTCLSGLTYSIGLTRFFFERLKKGRCIVS